MVHVYILHMYAELRASHTSHNTYFSEYFKSLQNPVILLGVASLFLFNAAAAYAHDNWLAQWSDQPIPRLDAHMHTQNIRAQPNCSQNTHLTPYSILYNTPQLKCVCQLTQSTPQHFIPLTLLQHPDTNTVFQMLAVSPPWLH